MRARQRCAGLTEHRCHRWEGDVDDPYGHLGASDAEDSGEDAVLAAAAADDDDAFAAQLRGLLE